MPFRVINAINIMIFLLTLSKHVKNSVLIYVRNTTWAGKMPRCSVIICSEDVISDKTVKYWDSNSSRVSNSFFLLSLEVFVKIVKYWDSNFSCVLVLIGSSFLIFVRNIC